MSSAAGRGVHRASYSIAQSSGHDQAQPLLLRQASLEGPPFAGGLGSAAGHNQGETSCQGGGPNLAQLRAENANWARLLQHICAPIRPSQRARPTPFFDYDDAMSSTSYPRMDKFESGRVKLFVHELRLKAITDVENKRGPGSVTADTFFEVLDSLPVPESQFETWWNSVKGTIQADAAAHFAAAAAGAAAGAPVLTAKQLLEFYAQKLMEHFSAEREQEVYRRFIALKQGTSKPSAFHSELKALHTELGSRVGAFELSERFEQGLHEKVRKHLDHTLITLSRSQRQARLPQTVSDADCIWDNLAPEVKVEPSKKKGDFATGGEVKAAQSASDQLKRRFCTHHGWNTTHSTEKCRNLSHQKSQQAHASEAMPGWVHQMVALFSQMQHGAAHGQGGHGASSQRGGGPGGVRCTFCERTGHTEELCIIKNPQFAPAGYKAPTPALQVLFEAIKAKQVGKVAACAAEYDYEEEYSYEEGDDYEGDDYEEEGDRAACCTHSFNVYKDEPWVAVNLPSDVPGHVAVHPPDAIALALSGPRPIPQSFQPRPLDTSVYPLPPIPRKEAIKPGVRREDALDVAVKAVANMPVATFLKRVLVEAPVDLPQAHEPVREALANLNSPWVSPERFTLGGIQYEVSGLTGTPPRTLAYMSPSEREQALVANPQAAQYLGSPSGMYYFPPEACGLIQAGDSGKGGVIRMSSLRDFAATISLIPTLVAQKHNLSTRPTSTRLSSSVQLGCSVRGELVTDGLSFVLLPNTPHATRIPLTQTLVVDVEPHLFEFLVGNEQGKLLGDGLQSFPSPALHFYPNLIESPDYRVSIPMTPFPSHKASALASVRAALISAASSSSYSPVGVELGGGLPTAEPLLAEPIEPTQTPVHSAQDGSSAECTDKHVAESEAANAPEAGVKVKGSSQRGSAFGILVFLYTMLLAGITSMMRVVSCTATMALAALGRVVEHACSATSPAGRQPGAHDGWKVRTGKRKRPRARLGTGVVPPPLPTCRSWWYFFSFALVAALLCALSAGVGATRGAISGSGLACSFNAVTTGGVFSSQAGVAAAFTRRHGMVCDPPAPTEPGGTGQLPVDGGSTPTPAERASVLQRAVDLSRVHEALSPCGAAFVIQGAPASKGVRVTHGQFSDPRYPSSSACFGAVQHQVSHEQQTSYLEPVSLSVSGDPLGLATPSVFRFAHSFVMACVLVSGIAAAVEVCMSWLKMMQEQEEWFRFRCFFGGYESEAVMLVTWLLGFATLVLKRFFMGKSRLIEDNV